MKKILDNLLLKRYGATLSAGDLVLAKRFNLFRTLSLLSLGVYIAFAVQVLVVVTHASLLLWSMVLLFVLTFLNYFTLSLHRNTSLAFLVLPVIWFLLVHMDSYYSGGIRNSANIYLATIILTAYMLTGTIGGIIMVGLAIIHLAYFFVLGNDAAWVNFSLVGNNDQLINLYYFLSTAISLVILAIQAGYIERSNKQIIKALQANEQELALKNEALVLSEARLAQQYKELQRKNNELEQFAFIASHDLQEPIRTAAGFAALLLRQYKDTMDENGIKCVSYIAASCDRMKLLIEELLNYSRIGFEEKKIAINCNEIMNEIVQDLGEKIMEQQALIVYHHLPEVTGSRVAIKQLFQNLVLNGIKFSRKNIAPVVIITGVAEGEGWHFTVSDNGIGIPEEHYEKIFVIFQRLHTRSVYDGSGIGLSSCKKIVELHQGSIWVVSNPGEGSSFHFTLKRNADV